MLPRSRKNTAFQQQIRAAWIPVLETLEGRRLFSATTVQTLPFLLDFSTDRGELLDKDGQGTGFTRVQANKLGTEYKAPLIDLDTAAGVLKLTITGTSTAGSNYNADNTQVNLLETQFDGTTSGFKISTRLVGPLGFINAPSEQGGISFGPDQDNWVKLVAISQPTGTFLQFLDETNGITHNLSSLTSIGSFASVNTLDLQLVGDATAGTVTAWYSVNSGALTKVAQVWTVPALKMGDFFNPAARAGLLAAQKNDLAPITLTFDSFRIDAGSSAAERPTVTRTRPADNETLVPRDAFVAADVRLPTAGAGIDSATLNNTTVKLYRSSDKLAVPGVINTSGGGDAIVFTPSGLLDPNTNYTFEVTSGLKDTSGAAFQPYMSSFTTGNTGGGTDPNLAFEKISLPTASGFTYTGVVVGPDGKLYASTDQGLIQRFSINADGTLGAAENINSLTAKEGAARIITGMAFDPASTASNLILWVTHGEAVLVNATDWTGKITKLTGPSLATATTMVVNLPRSIRDHMSNQLVFGPDGAIYFNQGAMSAMGAPDNTWGLRSEHLLSAATLRLDPSKLGALPLDVKTEAGGTYNPFAPSAPLTIYATGVRNAYDLVWTSDGKLYVPTNGSAAGGATPGSPDGSVPALPDVEETQYDYLFKVVQGGYYGHPNPLRNQYVLNGGNPTAGVDFAEVLSYPVGINPDPNYRGAAYVFGRNYSPNGVIQYHGSAFGGALEGRLLVTEYSGGDDVVVLTIGADGSISKAQSGIAGLTHFVDPLDITEDSNTGFLYVVEYGARRITLLRPIPPGANATPSTTALYFNDPANIAGSSRAQKITITNTGTNLLSFPADAFTITGPNAAQFTITQKPNLPTSIAPGQSVDVFVNYTATALATQTATLIVKSNDPDSPMMNIALRGLGTLGVGGTNEPSLQQILNLYQLPINVGDSNPSSTYLDGPIQPNDEVVMPTLLKAGEGPITIEPLASFGVGAAGVPTTRFGWYVPGNPTDQNEMFTITGDAGANSNSQTVRPLINGVTSFDPGSAAFGLYGFWQTMNPKTTTYSEDRLNTFDSVNKRKIRFYPYKTPGGATIANAYVFAFEEFTSNYDQQDFVGVIYNVKPAAVGPEIGLQNLDGVPLSDRLVFSKIQNPDNAWAGKPNNITHLDAKLRVYNSGTARLNISSMVLSPQWQFVGTVPTFIDSGNSADLTIRFIANLTGAQQNVNGTLVINSDDADEPAKTIQLDAWWQPESENQKEPSLQQVMDAFGWKTRIANAGQVLSNGGKLERVGDEVLSPFWRRADATQTVNVRQISSFHTQGNAARVWWFAQTSGTSNDNLLSGLTMDGDEAQSFLPHQDNGVFGSTGAAYAQASFSPTVNFGFNIDGEKSDPTRNAQPNPGDQGHHVRFWVVRDANGIIIPNTYIMTMDYSGINYDYNDNTYLITNVQPVSPPSVPTGLSALGSGAGIALNWSDNTEANLAGYNVYRSTSAAGPWTKINSILLTTSDFNDVAAPTGALVYYQITAVDNVGNESGPAAISASRTNDTTAPAPPSNPVATGSTSGISIDWPDNTEGDLAGYNVYRSSSPTGPFTQKLNTTLLSGSSFFDSTAAVGATSYYRVTAVDTTGNESGQSATASAFRPATNDTTPPAIPTGPNATGSTGGISVTWNANTDGDLAGYNVYRSNSPSGPFTTKVNTNLLTTNAVFDSTALVGSTTYYVVTAVDTTGNESAQSAVASALRPAPGNNFTSADIGSPAPAGSTTVITNNTDYDVFAGGADIFGTSDQFRFVYQQLTGDFDIKVRLNSLSNTDQYAKAGLMARESLNANSRHAFIASMPGAQGHRFMYRASTGGTTTSTPGGVVNYPNEWLRLKRVGQVFTGYYSTDGATWTQVSNVTLATMPATLYFGMAAVSKVATQTIDAEFRGLANTNGAQQDLPPAQPTGASTSATSTQIVIDWNDNTENDLAGYNIYRSTSPSGPWTKLNTAGLLTASNYTDTDVITGQTWYYQVKAVDAAGQESSAAPANATVPAPPDTTKPAPPGTITPTASQSGIALDWPDNTESDLAGYNVYRASSPTGTFSKINGFLVTGSSYNDTTAAPGATSYYYVTAVDKSGNESDPSATASATRPALPAFSSADIGGATPAGSTTVVTESKDYNITGGGSDIWGASDQFRYVYKQLTGNFDIKVQIAGLTPAQALSKAGLMARETLSADAKEFFVNLNASGGIRTTSRDTTAGQSISQGTGTGAAPNCWLRLVRSGNTFTGYSSTDGVNWTIVGSANITMANTIYIGMAVLSHDPTKLATAQFRNLT